MRNNPLFLDATKDEILVGKSPYRRPTRIHDNNFINYDKPLIRSEQESNAALSTHRLLLNIYESDGVFLPIETYPEFWHDFQTFYSAESIARGEAIRQKLERKAFSFLEDEIDILGPWTAKTAMEFFYHFLSHEQTARSKNAESHPVLAAILRSRDSERCARHYLIQLAGDFLSEASAMARVIPGSYGEIQSAIFNILIDEYGAAVHSSKHSTLFEDTLSSVDLSPRLHEYWQFYQATSLCLTNYFHFVTKNKRNFFRYISALYYTESSLVNTARKQSEMLHQVFGDRVNTTYFDEHVHIDQHHGKMALERVILPAFNRFGDAIVTDVVRGFLEFQLLEALADEDLAAQLAFFDGLEHERAAAKFFYCETLAARDEVPRETFVEHAGERSTTHAHPDHRLLAIESGTMDFWPLFGDPVQLGPGDVLSIPKHRLHGSVVTSDECTYHQPIVDPSELQSYAVSEPEAV